VQGILPPLKTDSGISGFSSPDSFRARIEGGAGPLVGNSGTDGSDGGNNGSGGGNGDISGGNDGSEGGNGSSRPRAFDNDAAGEQSANEFKRREAGDTGLKLKLVVMADRRSCGVDFKVTSGVAASTRHENGSSWWRPSLKASPLTQKTFLVGSSYSLAPLVLDTAATNPSDGRIEDLTFALDDAAPRRSMWIVPKTGEIHGEFASCGRFHATVYADDKGGKRAPLERFGFFVEAKLCCCLPDCAEKALFGVREWLLRNVLRQNWFEAAVLLMIIWSSVMLAFEDYRLRDNPPLQSVLASMNVVFAVVFTAECVLKIVGFGWSGYFGLGWNILDFAIVVVALLSLVIPTGGSGAGVASLKSLRTLRALRPLRAIRRWEGMRIIVNAMISSIPAVCNVLIVVILIWLIFGIVAVQFFGGTFERCIYASTGELVNASLVGDKADCCAHTDHPDPQLNVSMCTNYHGDVFNGSDPVMAAAIYTWDNPKVNFDTVPLAFIALFQVATFEGWMALMDSAVDAVGVGKQPQFENQFGAYTYFLLFITVGSFFTLNLFIGVIIENFQERKRIMSEKTETGLGYLLTDKQKQMVNSFKTAFAAKPKLAPSPASDGWRKHFYAVATSKKFEVSVMLVILANSIFFSLKHLGQDEVYDDVLEASRGSLFTTAAAHSP
jgi:hypothetical protein